MESESEGEVRGKMKKNDEKTVWGKLYPRDKRQVQKYTKVNYYRKHK